MGTALAVLLFVLKCIGILLLVVLVLLIIALLIPLGIDVFWEPSRYTVHARYGPIRYLLMPREEKPAKTDKANKKEKSKEKKKQKSKEKLSDKEQENQIAVAPTARTMNDGQTAQAKPQLDNKEADAEKNKQEKQELEKIQITKRADKTETKRELKQNSEQDDGGLMDDIKNSLQLILKELRGDPFGTIQNLLDEFAPLIGRLLHGIHVKHLRVLWTITGEDAAQTAIAYGRAITLSNIVLERVQELMDVKADSLRLEPDFTNQMAEMRHLSCQITIRPCIIAIIGIKLLWRFLHRGKQR